MNMLELLQSECEKAGIECFVVGGALRDRLLNVATPEVDLAIATDPGQMVETLRERTGCSAFWLDRQRGILRISYLDEAFDLALLSGPLEHDLQQRDFTINAMAQRLEDYLNQSTEIIDPYGGRGDLGKRLLRPVTPDSMQADPVRILRGVRLLITRDLQLHEPSAGFLREASHLISSSPAERVSQELGRILTCANAPAGVDHLHHLGVVDALLPEVSAMRGVTQNKYHQYTVDDHANKAFAAFVDVIQRHQFLTERAAAWAAEYWSGITQDIRYVIMLAAWLHDIGKPPTRAVRNGKVTFYGHEHTGSAMSKDIARRLRLSRQQADLLQAFIKYHMYPMQLWRTGKLDGRLLHRYYHRVGSVGVPVVLFTLADHLAKGEAIAESEQFREHLQVVERFLEAWFEHSSDVVSPRPLLTGDEIAALLGQQPGPWLQRIKELLLEAQAGGQVAERSQAELFVRQAAQENEQGRRSR